jgi:hypothetical protein
LTLPVICSIFVLFLPALVRIEGTGGRGLAPDFEIQMRASASTHHIWRNAPGREAKIEDQSSGDFLLISKS